MSRASAKAEAGAAKPLEVAGKIRTYALSTQKRQRREAPARKEEPLRPEDQDALDQLEVIDAAIDELTAGQERAWLEVYVLVPPPTRRRRIATLWRVKPGHLMQELVGVCQSTSTWGDVDLQLIQKATCPRPHGKCRGGLFHVRRVVPRVALFVPRTATPIR